MPYGTGSLLVKDPGALRRSHSVPAHYMPGMQDDADSVDFCEISRSSPATSAGSRSGSP